MSLQGANLVKDSFEGALSPYDEHKVWRFGSVLGDVYEYSKARAWFSSHGEGELSRVGRWWFVSYEAGRQKRCNTLAMVAYATITRVSRIEAVDTIDIRINS
jgi:hypothetical protein